MTPTDARPPPPEVTRDMIDSDLVICLAPVRNNAENPGLDSLLVLLRVVLRDDTMNKPPLKCRCMTRNWIRSLQLKIVAISSPSHPRADILETPAMMMMMMMMLRSSATYYLQLPSLQHCCGQTGWLKSAPHPPAQLQRAEKSWDHRTILFSL